VRHAGENASLVTKSAPEPYRPASAAQAPAPQAVQPVAKVEPAQPQATAPAQMQSAEAPAIAGVETKRTPPRPGRPSFRARRPGSQGEVRKERLARSAALDHGNRRCG
jgi:hypothetical protein